MAFPEPFPPWMIEQLHLVSDNLHMQNTGQTVLKLSLYKWDGAAWVENTLGRLDPTDHRWFTLTPLSILFPGQSRPAGESVLVVRAEEIKKGQSASWRMDNMHNAWLQMAAYAPAAGFSRSNACKLLGSYSLKPKTYGWGILTTFSLDPIDGHWEYWFDDVVLWPKPMP